MRESLGRAVNASDLQGCDWRSTSLDKIHALGLAKGLPEMIHFLDGLQPKSYKALTYEVAKQARLNISRWPLHKLCRLAIFETCFHFCQDCLGAKELMADQLRIVCHTCAGSACRRFYGCSMIGIKSQRKPQRIDYMISLEAILWLSLAIVFFYSAFKSRFIDGIDK